MIFIIVLWGKHFPLMKYRGYKKLYKYMDIQKIPKKDIKDIKSYKDIKFDGYFYYVYLKDYPNYTLCYEYTRDGKFFLAVEKEINGINNMLDENELKISNTNLFLTIGRILKNRKSGMIMPLFYILFTPIICHLVCTNYNNILFVPLILGAFLVRLFLLQSTPKSNLRFEQL